MYNKYKHEKKRNKRVLLEILAIVCTLSLIANIGQFITSRAPKTRADRIESALASSVRQEITSAQKAVLQLTRTGGSNTSRLLSEIRQSLYSVTRMNELNGTVNGTGKALLPQNTVNAALDAVSECESLLLSARSIDAPQANLIQLIGALNEEAASI